MNPKGFVHNTAILRYLFVNLEKLAKYYNNQGRVLVKLIKYVVWKT